MTLITAMKKRLGLCAFALVLGTTYSLPALAIVEQITAVFRPDPANPTSNKFVNTTPQSGLCPWHVPARCEAVNTFSIRNSSFRAYSNGPIPAFPEDPRQSAYFKVPSAFRDLQVTHTVTGRAETVQMRIAGIGGRWNVSYPPGVSGWATPGVGWNAYWRGAPAPCLPINYMAAGQAYALFSGSFQRTPEPAALQMVWKSGG